MVERYLGVVEAGGSSPSIQTIWVVRPFIVSRLVATDKIGVRPIIGAHSKLILLKNIIGSNPIQTAMLVSWRNW